MHKIHFYITVKFSTNYKNVNTEVSNRNLFKIPKKTKETTPNQLLL
jgi:hypothetical protein